MAERPRQRLAYMWYVAAAAMILVFAALLYAGQDSPRLNSVQSTTVQVHYAYNITDNEIVPGPYPQSSCPGHAYQSYGRIYSFSGFAQYNVSGLTDYVIAPAGNGTISYMVRLGPDLASLNGSSMYGATNWAQFSHTSSANTTLDTHPGINVSITPKNETVPFNSSYSVSVHIGVLPNATIGTYMASFSPGFCFGGPIFLLTVGSSAYNGIMKQAAPS